MPEPGGPTLELLLDIASGRLGSGRMGKGVWLDFPEQVFRDLPQDERNRLPERFAESQSNEEKAFLASMLLASDDHEIFLMLVGDPVGQVVIRRQSWSARQNQDHTSELQSLLRISYAVFCLKKKTRTTHTNAQ